MPSPLLPPKPGSTPSPGTPPAPARPRKTRWFAWTLAGVMAAGGYGIYRQWLVLPERFNPWAPLNVNAPLDVFTDYKLSRTRSDPALCLTALAQTDMQYDVLPDRVTGLGCGFSNAVRLRSAKVRFGAPLPVSCPMALSFFMWERHTLQAAAQQHLGQQVAAIEHLGSYACRNINRGEPAGSGVASQNESRSRHATANALDIAAFTLENGRRITVLNQWRRAGARGPGASAEALMLLDAHQGACRFFTGVLSPDYNVAHRDHFHLETGGYSMCR